PRPPPRRTGAVRSDHRPGQRAEGRAGRPPPVRPADIGRTERRLGPHGTKAVFFGREVPVFRGVISVPAGMGAAVPLGGDVVSPGRGRRRG
ncbi:hypothetical protein GA0115260_114151, partial [Streptomyces sp. MnatMP-M27]